MAASIQQQIAQLENLSRFQQRFVSDVSHELRTPLTTIRMAGDLIHDSRQDFDPAVARSELLHNELDRFESLLTDLLEISRFDAGAAVLDVEPSRHAGSASSGSSKPCSRSPTPRAVVVNAPAPDQPCEAEIDSRRVERILRNLSSTRSSTARACRSRCAIGVGRPAASPSRCATTGSGCGPARRRWSSTGSGGPTPPGRARPVAPAWAWPSPWRTRGCTTAGCRPGACRGEGSCFRLTLPRVAAGHLVSSPLPLNPTLAEVARATVPASNPSALGSLTTGLSGPTGPSSAGPGAPYPSAGGTLHGGVGPRP